MIYLYTNCFFDQEGSGIKKYVQLHLNMLKEINYEFTLVTSSRSKNFEYPIIKILPKKALIILCFLGLDKLYMKFIGVEKIHDLDFSVPFNLKNSITTLHDLYPELINGRSGVLNYLVRSRIFRNSDRGIIKLIAVSRETASKANKIKSIESLVISNYISNSFLIKPLNHINRSGIIIIGRQEHRKNLVSAILAYSFLPKTLREQHPLHIIGPPGNVSIKNFLERNYFPEAKKIFWHGFISDEELHRFMKTSKVLLMPSICEGFGYPIYEGIVHGLNVVASVSLEIDSPQYFFCAYDNIMSIGNQLQAALINQDSLRTPLESFKDLRSNYFSKYKKLYDSII